MPCVSRVLTVAATLWLITEGAPPARITGLSHVAFYTSDLAKARSFYSGLLGYEELYDLPASGAAPRVTAFKINDDQWIELVSGVSPVEGQLDHVALRTDDASGVRALLESRGVTVPERVEHDRTGNRSFVVHDPDEHRLEIIEYTSGGPAAGRKPGASRISDRALHAGILVGNLDASVAFYGGILGFTEFWRGAAANSATLSWVNMRAPGATDYLEFMLYERLPAADARGSAHHLCLLVPDMDKALAAIEASPARAGYARPLAIRTGINRKRQLNLFDPDGTRVELMEPETVDGGPAPSSPLPPPRPSGAR